MKKKSERYSLLLLEYQFSYPSNFYPSRYIFHKSNIFNVFLFIISPTNGKQGSRRKNKNFKLLLFATMMAEWSENRIVNQRERKREKKKEEIQKVTSQVRISRRDTAKKREHRIVRKKQGKKKKRHDNGMREEVLFKRRIPMKRKESEGKGQKRRGRRTKESAIDRRVVGFTKILDREIEFHRGRSDHRPQASFLVRCIASDRISSFLETSHEYFSPRHRPLANVSRDGDPSCPRNFLRFLFDSERNLRSISTIFDF